MKGFTSELVARFAGAMALGALAMTAACDTGSPSRPSVQPMPSCPSCDGGPYVHAVLWDITGPVTPDPDPLEIAPPNNLSAWFHPYDTVITGVTTGVHALKGYATSRCS